MIEWHLVIADVMIVAGTAVMTVSIAGLMRFPDVFAKIHAASTAVALGVLLVLAASIPAGGIEMILRALLVGVFLYSTSPVSAHALARAERLLRGRGRGRS